MQKMTSLSAGYAVRDIIASTLGDRITAVYPVVSVKNATMPYVVYFRTSTASNPTKQANAFDTCQLNIQVYTSDYATGVSLMEDIRAAVEGKTINYVDDDDATLRMKVDCSLITDSQEAWDGDSFLQEISIDCKIKGNY